MFCDTPYERHLYKNMYYFSKHLYVYPVKQITSPEISCTSRMALEKLGPESES